jgi:hypothetical protein
VEMKFGRVRRKRRRESVHTVAMCVLWNSVGVQIGPKIYWTEILAETNGPNHGNVSSFIIRYRYQDSLVDETNDKILQHLHRWTQWLLGRRVFLGHTGRPINHRE